MHLQHARYLRHFHLTAEPFALTPDPEFLYLSPAHAEALAALTLGVTGRNGLVVLSGEVGTGKTTLVYSLLRTIGDGMRTAFVSNTGLGFDGLLRLALADFGVASPSPSHFDMLAALNAMLRECAEHGRTAVLVVDEAHLLADEDFEQLRLLGNFETFTEKLLQIVLVGQPEIETRLRGRALRALTERVAVHCRLTSLGRLESRAYLDYRLLRAGGSSRLFEPAARDLLLERAQGIPRRINILCHNALLFAYGRGEARVTASCAQAAIDARAALMDLPDVAPEPGAAAPGPRRRRLGLAAAAAAAAAVAVAAAAGAWRATDVPPPASTLDAALVAAPPAVPAPQAPVSAPPPEEAASQRASDSLPAVPADEIPADTAAADPAAADGAEAGEAQPVQDAPHIVVEAAATTASGDADSEPVPPESDDAAPTAGDPPPPPAPAAVAAETVVPSAGERAPRRPLAVRVESGQTLAALARAVYGGFDPEIARRIQRANPQIVDPDRILAGDLLRFPDLQPGGSEEDHRP